MTGGLILAISGTRYKGKSPGTGDAIARARHQWKPMLILPIEQPRESA